MDGQRQAPRRASAGRCDTGFLRRSACYAVVLLLAGAATDAALARWSVLVGVGPTFPWSADSFQAGLKLGFGITLGVGYRPSRALEIVARLGRNRFERDDDGVVQHSGILERPVRVLQLVGGSMSVNELLADLRFFPSQGRSSAPTHPYLLGAVGVASYHYERTDIEYAYAGHTWPETVPEARDTNLSLGLGAGVRFDIGRRMGIVLEGRYQVIAAGEQLRSVPFRIEWSLGF
ncbi:MAG: hypothetical protein JSW67_01855 [Candidatus Latescibacterota bacterium]|nr:MAG: hypothetical protein JSW67_01855 [Candidatus Latescibacterota bacterium]